MKKLAQTVLVVGVGIIFAMSIMGCGEQNAAAKDFDVKKHQLIAAENIQLKQQLEQRAKELDNCLQEKKDMEKKFQDDVAELAKGALEDFEKSVKLQEENEKLKSEIKELQKESERLEGEISRLKEGIEESEEEPNSMLLPL